MRCWE